jgi:hypothetical protein
MKNERTKYGYGCVGYVKTRKKFEARFNNPLDKKTVFLGYFDIKEDAETALKERNFYFYSANPQLLPRCISVDNSKRQYVLTFTVNKKQVRYGIFDFLGEAISAKLDFINSLID